MPSFGCRKEEGCWAASGAGKSRCDSIALSFSLFNPNLNAPQMNLDPSTTKIVGQSRCHSSASTFNPFTQDFNAQTLIHQPLVQPFSACSSRKWWRKRWQQWRRTKSKREPYKCRSVRWKSQIFIKFKNWIHIFLKQWFSIFFVFLTFSFRDKIMKIDFFHFATENLIGVFLFLFFCAYYYVL